MGTTALCVRDMAKTVMSLLVERLEREIENTTDQRGARGPVLGVVKRTTKNKKQMKRQTSC